LLMIAVLVGVQIAEQIQTSIATSTGVGGVFVDTAAGALLALVPLVFVAGLVLISFFNKGKQ